MAVVADISDLDLIVEPHELTQEDREAFRKAIKKHRDRRSTRDLSNEAARILAERREPMNQQKRQ
jgi:predicted transposase YdaD